MARKDNQGRNLHTGEVLRADGRYMYRYVDKAGKRQNVYAHTLQELREIEKQIAKDLDDNILTDSAVKRITVQALFEKYMETKALSDTTRFNYINMWNLHAKGEIGNIKVVQLRSSHIKAFYAKMSKAEYSHSTIKLIHNLLYPTLEMAVDDDIIRKNPAKNALLNGYGEEAKERDILTIEQQNRLFDFMSSSNVYNVYVPMIEIMLETGLRCGELIGLTWSDVDMKEKQISVNHQLIYKNVGSGYKFFATTPKTESGIRIIPLTHTAYKAFSEQRKINFMLGRTGMEDIDGYSDFVFLAKTGRPLMPSAVNNVIYNIIKGYNKEELINAKKQHRKAELLPKISAHCMRHTACTNMARKGINVKVLQYIMGHAHIDVTMDVYNHISDIADVKEEIAKYESVVGG